MHIMNNIETGPCVLFVAGLIKTFFCSSHHLYIKGKVI